MQNQSGRLWIWKRKDRKKDRDAAAPHGIPAGREAAGGGTGGQGGGKRGIRAALARSYVLPLLGLLLAAAGFLPYLLLGTGSVVTVNDQLDGEIFTYLFGASCLGTGQELIGQWMGGIGREALFPPSLLTVLFYVILPPFAAFMVNQFLLAMTAYLGMYAFLKRVIGSRWIVVTVALLFAYLPFYSVYGLTAVGLPMLAAAVAELVEGRHKVRNVLLVVLYGFASSFVLLGFAVCGLLVLYGIRLFLKKGPGRCGPVCLAALLLMAIYGACNLGLIRQVLGIGAAQVSHKTEYVLHAQPFWKSFFGLLKDGSGHAPSFHGGILVLTAITLAAGALFYKRLEESGRTAWRRIAALFLAALAIAAFYAGFHSAPVTAVRQRLGGFFVYFQLDRIYWFYPFLWYTALALELQLLYGVVRRAAAGQRGGRIKRGIGSAFLVTVCGIAAFNVLWNSDFKKNIRQLLDPASSNAVTWEKYYGEDIFRQIAEHIGRPKEEYRVGSVALNPAAAAYNGFYTVDGYSNNYPLAYKHAFRRVIAGELEKEEALRRYFDDWGNRCYLFTAQLGQQYYFEKENAPVLSGILWDMDALRELGCEYLFSGLEIVDAQRMGLTLTGSFDSEGARLTQDGSPEAGSLEREGTGCRYRIWVYELGHNRNRK